MTLDLFAEGTHASHLAVPGSEKARTMTATSGRKCIELLKLSGRDGSLPRMLLDTSAWASTLCYLTWKPKTTPTGRLLFRLVPSMPSTEGIECGLWRTPTAEDSANRTFARNNRGEPKLSAQVKLWPTLRANDPEKRGDFKNDPRNGLPAAAKFWPTAHANCSTGAGQSPKKQGGENLQTAVAGQLNPTWVEWLMGYPEGWTDLKDSATP